MKLQNTGQLTLTSVSATSTPTYLANNCSSVATLAPGQWVDCLLTATATQDDYDAGTLQLAVDANAQHSGNSALTLGGTRAYSSSIALNNSASMDLVVHADRATVAAAGAHIVSWLRHTTAVHKAHFMRRCSLMVVSWAQMLALKVCAVSIKVHAPSVLRTPRLRMQVTR
jgi:hypothetical protein